jgi:hypothetical protein
MTGKPLKSYPMQKRLKVDYSQKPKKEAHGNANRIVTIFGSESMIFQRVTPPGNESTRFDWIIYMIPQANIKMQPTKREKPYFYGFCIRLYIAFCPAFREGEMDAIRPKRNRPARNRNPSHARE